jgi:anti-anti-sigma factor
MKISVTEQESVTVLQFEGNLDTNTAPDAEESFKRAIADGAERLLADFTALDYVSSAGLRVLLATAKQLGAKGGSLRICSLNETVKEVFDMSGFSTILQVFDDQEEALKGF